MYLLSDNSWGDFPTWVQAGCAMITLMLVIMGLLQNRRIQELTDIVKELSNQTMELKNQSDILAKRYELEQTLSIKNRMPYFEKRLFYRTSTYFHTLQLINVGVDAIDVRMNPTVKQAKLITNIELSDQDDVKHNRGVNFNIRYSDPLNDSELDFSFSIDYYDNPGNVYNQKIYCQSGTIRIDPPVIQKMIQE